MGRTKDGRRRYDWAEIQAFHDDGNGFVACRARFGFTHGAWNKAIARGELRTAARQFGDRRRRYDWTEVQAYYDEGHTLAECRERFGFAIMTWQKARHRGEVAPRPAGMPIGQLLKGRRCRTHVKVRLLRAGVLENRCELCGLTDWQGRPLSMQIDHINGIRDDNRIENLRMLCPNCHSQTDTFSGRNAKQKRLH